MLQKTENLPPKLQAVLAENKPDFVIRGGRERLNAFVDLLGNAYSFVFALVLLTVLILSIKDMNYHFHNSSTKYHLAFWSLVVFIILIVFGALYELRRNYREITNSICHLFCKPPYFVSTYKYFISYYRGEIMMIHWRNFNPSYIIEKGNGSKGNLTFRLYYNEHIIDEYSNEEIFDIRELTLIQIEDVEKIAQMCRKRIDQFDSFE